MKKLYDFKVAPYALYDVIKALYIGGEKEYVNLIVTKEDNDLIVRVYKEKLPKKTLETTNTK